MSCPLAQRHRRRRRPKKKKQPGESGGPRPITRRAPSELADHCRNPDTTARLLWVQIFASVLRSSAAEEFFSSSPRRWKTLSLATAYFCFNPPLFSCAQRSMRRNAGYSGQHGAVHKTQEMDDLPCPSRVQRPSMITSYFGPKSLRSNSQWNKDRGKRASTYGF